jgi:hypothetical protein
MEFSLLVVVKEYLIDHETFFFRIALAIAEVQTPNFFAMSAIAILSRKFLIFSLSASRFREATDDKLSIFY